MKRFEELETLTLLNIYQANPVNYKVLYAIIIYYFIIIYYTFKIYRKL